MKPKRLAVIDAFVSVIAGCRSIKGAEHDPPFEYEGRKYPFAFVYDSDEEYNLASLHGHSVNTLTLESATVFEWSEQRGKTPRVAGSRLLAEQLQAVAKDCKLSGFAIDTQPMTSSIGEIVTDDGSKLAAAVCRWRIEYTYPQTNPFAEEV